MGDQRQPFTWTRGHWIALLVLCLVQLLEAIDVTVANVALPTIQRQLSFSSSGLQWVVNIYAIAFGGFLLLGGRAGDLWGRRRVLLAGIGVFTVASLASALAQDPGMLVASRAIQGLGAAFSSPMTLGMLSSIFPEGAARNRAVSVWGMTAGVSASLGLVLGGVLVSGLGWRWIFLINIPFGIAILILGRRSLPAERPVHRHRSFDVAGAVTVTAGLSLLAYAVVQTAGHGWGSPRTIVLLVVAVLLLAAFAVNESRVASDPLLPAALLRNRSVVGANVVSALFGSGLAAMFYFTALYQQQVMQHTALATGLLMVPLTAVLIISSGFDPVLIPRLGVRFTTALGAGIATLGLVLIARSSPHGTAFSNIIGPSIVMSVGFGLIVIPLTIAAVAGVAPRHTGVASGLLNTTRQMAAALGLAVIATIAAGHSEHLLHAGHAARGALSGGFDLGYAISAALMAVTAIAALLLLRDDGRGEPLDMTAIATAGADTIEPPTVSETPGT